MSSEDEHTERTDEQTGENTTEGTDETEHEAKTVPIYLVGFALVLTLLFANVVIAANGTVMDSEATTETLAQEGVFDEVATAIQNDIGATIAASSDRIDEADGQEIAAQAVTEEYIQTEISRNIDALYAYLEGEQEDAVLALDLGEPRDEILDEVPFSVRGEIEDDIPEQENLTEGAQIPGEADGAEQGFGVVSTLTLVFPALALLLVGAMYHYTGRSVHNAARSSGIAFAIAGVIGVGFGFVAGAAATGSVESALDVESEELQAFTDGMVAVVDGLFSTIVQYGLYTTAIGLLAVGGVYADENGYLDDLKGDGDDQQYQQGHQGQYQQDQYQQEQYQQGQQGQQDQHQQDHGVTESADTADVIDDETQNDGQDSETEHGGEETERKDG